MLTPCKALLGARIQQSVCRAHFPLSRHYVGVFIFLLLVSVAGMCQEAEGGNQPDAAAAAGNAAYTETAAKNSQEQPSPEQELIFEGQRSIGHFHLYVGAWYSELGVGGVEYDRHSWGKLLGARLDYCAEFLPVMILQQPRVTDVWGNPHSRDQETLYGMGFSPIGARLLWRDGKQWMPYFNGKGGLAAFDKKAISQYASYLNFTLQFGSGVQFRLSRRIDWRMGVDYFHVSNAFIVPSNPGLDSIHGSFGLSYHLGRERR